MVSRGGVRGDGEGEKKKEDCWFLSALSVIISLIISIGT